MSDEYEEQVAGVTLYFKKSAAMKAVGKEKLHIHLELDCLINDEPMWDEIQGKFKKGFRVFAGVDFHQEVNSVMRDEMEKLKTENLQLQRGIRQANDERDLARDELSRYKGPLQALGRALGR